MSRNTTLYSTIFISGLVSGFIIRDYLPEDLNTLDKIRKKMKLFYENKKNRISRKEMANKAEQRLKNDESNSSSS